MNVDGDAGFLPTGSITYTGLAGQGVNTENNVSLLSTGSIVYTAFGLLGVDSGEAAEFGGVPARKRKRITAEYYEELTGKAPFPIPEPPPEERPAATRRLYPLADSPARAEKQRRKRNKAIAMLLM